MNLRQWWNISQLATDPNQWKTDKRSVLLIVIGLPLGVAIIFGIMVLVVKISKTKQTITKTTTALPTIFKVDKTVIDSSWKTYSNVEGHFSIKHPPTWRLTQKKTDMDEIFENGIVIQGTEGEVTVSWSNVAPGGGCPEEYMHKLEIGSQQQDICSYVDDNGDEYFGQLSNQSTASRIFTYAGATVKQPYSEHRNVVLNVLSSLRFSQ